MNEKQTRKEIVDTRLKQAGWNVADRTQVIEEYDISVDKNIVNRCVWYSLRLRSAIVFLRHVKLKPVG